MSKEAMEFIKSLKVGYFATKFTLRAIARKTFNDSCLCRCGIEGLVKETERSERTISRHISKLKKLGVIQVHRRAGTGFGRLRDDIELVGFKDWLQAQGCLNAQPARVATSNMSLVADIYKDTLKTRKTKRQGIYHDRNTREGAATTQEAPPQLSQVSDDDWASLQHVLGSREDAVEVCHADCEDLDGEVLQ